MSDDKTTHKFEAEVEQVLRLVIESLYSHPEVFLRELLSNAADALDKRRFRGVTDPKLLPEGTELDIRLIPDHEAGTLTISDAGVGMSRDELVKNLGTIAQSGTRELMNKLKEAKESGDLSLIGQFGVGFYSSYLVASRVEVVSRAAGAEEAFRWSSDGKGSFSVEPAERDAAGTSVTLHLEKEHEGFADPVELRRLVRRYSDYLSWPILLRTSKKEGDDYVTAFQKINEGNALWQRPASEVTDEQVAELYRHLASDFDKPLAHRQFRLEGTQEFSGIVFLPKRAPMTIWMPESVHGMRLYVKRVFIMDDADALLPRWLRFIRGVVDSEDLPLNVSREILQDSRVTKVIQKQVVKQTLDMLKELADERPDDYLTFFETFGAVLKEGLHLSPDQADALKPLLRYRSSAAEGLTSLAEAKERMKEDQKALYYVVGESVAQVSSSPHIEALKKKGYEVLYMVDPVDAFAVDALGDFDGVTLESASDAKLDLGGDDAVDEDREAALKDLRDRFRSRLQEHVSEVRLSARLTDSAVCLVVPPGGMDPHVERLLRAAQKDMPLQKRILELNPTHPIVENLRALIEKGEAIERVDEWIELLYEMARVAEGTPLDDPSRFNRRVSALLRDASERLVPSGAEAG